MTRLPVEKLTSPRHGGGTSWQESTESPASAMWKIYWALCAITGACLVLSYLLGTISKLRDGVNNPNDSIFWYHFLSGLATAVLTLFVHCLIFTYFLGTGRWVKEVKLAYRLDDEPWPKLTRDLKRRVFPPALFAMLSAIATGAAGAAAQVHVVHWTVHATLGTLALAVNFWAFRVELQCLRTNGTVLAAVMAQVDLVRQARGLPPNAEALLAESQERSVP